MKRRESGTRFSWNFKRVLLYPCEGGRMRGNMGIKRRDRKWPADD
jgi:hypothetical protein